MHVALGLLFALEHMAEGCITVYPGCRDFITNVFWDVTHSPAKVLEGSVEHGLTKRWKIMQSALILLPTCFMTMNHSYQSTHLCNHPSIHPPSSFHTFIQHFRVHHVSSARLDAGSTKINRASLSLFLHLFKDIIWCIESDTWTNTLMEALSHTSRGVCPDRVAPPNDLVGKSTLY